MKEVEMTTKIPATMTMIINATYNETEEIWEVSICEIGTCKCAKTNKPMYYQRNSNIELQDECDEYVVPVAVLEHNGVDTTEMRFVTGV